MSVPGKPHAKVLVVDDEPGSRFGIKDYLESCRFTVEESETLHGGLKRFQETQPDAAVVDHRLPDGNALDAIAKMRALDPTVPVIVLTGYGSIELAVTAMRHGAQHFLTKPLDLRELAETIERAIAARRTLTRRATDRPDVSAPFDPFAGISPAMQTLQEQARRLRVTDGTILLVGETGSGKGVLAQWLHRHSRRGAQPFIDVNCAALSPEFLATELFGHGKGAFTSAVASKTGLLELAHGGTMFLDEIGDMSAPVQAMLLKVLEEKRFRRMGETQTREVDVRLIAATHRELGQAVASGSFRSDLYYRIRSVVLRLPPLRERIEDIPILAEMILQRWAAAHGETRTLRLSPAALRTLAALPWPGNIRELRNVIERTAVFASGEEIQAAELILDEHVRPPAGEKFVIADPEPQELTLAELEQRHIRHVLREEGGHVERAAKRLGIPRSSLYAWIKSGRVERVTGEGEDPLADAKPRLVRG